MNASATPDGSARLRTAAHGAAPIAAMSLSETASALCPSCSGDIQSSRKWTPSTSRSDDTAVSNPGREASSALSSPIPSTTPRPRPPVNRLIAAMRSNSPDIPAASFDDHRIARRASMPRSIVSGDVEYENLRWPSPSGPNMTPGRQATPARSSSRFAISQLFDPKARASGKA